MRQKISEICSCEGLCLCDKERFCCANALSGKVLVTGVHHYGSDVIPGVILAARLNNKALESCFFEE